MKILIILGLLILRNLASAEPGDVSNVLLETGAELRVEDSKKAEVTITGVSTSRDKAWQFDTNIKESLFADTLILVIEVLSKMP